MSNVALPHHYTGKVRELYEVGHDRMLVVASDRISVFDVVLDDKIPDKGRVLTALSTFWFERDRRDLAPNHLVSADPTDFPETAGPDVAGRAMLVPRRPAGTAGVRRARLPVRRRRGTDYEETGYGAGPAAAGRPAAGGTAARRRSSRPPRRPRQGHDLPLTDAEAADARRRRRVRAAARPHARGSTSSAPRTPTRAACILADTKLEFGTIDDTLLVIDEMLTPDSSRYWPAEEYQVGISPPSFDKQYVRDHYLSIGWDQEPPGAAAARSRDRRHAGALRRGLRARSPARASTSGTRARSRVRPVYVRRGSTSTHLPGILDPAGRDGRAGAPGARLRQRLARSRSPRPSASCSTPTSRPTPRAQVDEMCQRLLANPVIEQYTVEIAASKACQQRP